MTASVIYKGSLRCEAIHLQSDSIIETDAPRDNRGQGERFSPTDLLCVSLATCIVTTMGIKAGDMGIDLTDTKIEVTKHMLTEPRSVGKIEVTLHLPSLPSLEENDKKILQRTGDTCPVTKSLHPDVEVIIKYVWGN